MNCGKLCASDTRLICDQPEGHAEDHAATNPDGGRSQWPEGWGVTVGVPATGPIPDPNPEPAD